MTVGAATAGLDPVNALLNDATEIARKAAAMLGPDQAWALSSTDLVRVLHGAEAAASVVMAVQLAAVREVDVRGLATADGQASTAAWLGKKLTLTPGQARARVKDAGLRLSS